MKKYLKIILMSGILICSIYKYVYATESDKFIDIPVPPGSAGKAGITSEDAQKQEEEYKNSQNESQEDGVTIDDKFILNKPETTESNSQQTENNKQIEENETNKTSNNENNNINDEQMVDNTEEQTETSSIDNNEDETKDNDTKSAIVHIAIVIIIIIICI